MITDPQVQTELRTYVFCCASATDRDEWVVALNEECPCEFRVWGLKFSSVGN